MLSDAFRIIYWSTPVATMETIRLWVVALAAPLATAVGFFFINAQLRVSAQQARTAAQQAETAANAYKTSLDSAERARTQAHEEQIWRRARFLAEEVEAFFFNESVARVIYMLDWQERSMTLPAESKRKILVVQSLKPTPVTAKPKASFGRVGKKEVIALDHALRSDKDGPDFDDDEMALRDEFDTFCFKLGQLQHLSEAGLFSYEDLEIHLRYVLDLISGGIPRVSLALRKRIVEYVKEYDFPAVSRLIEARQKARGPSI
jgi:hypothetical protein